MPSAGKRAPGRRTAGSVLHRSRKKSQETRKRKIAMGRIVLAGVVAGIWVSLATPGFAQTNEACVLRCLDHGNLDQTCQARCTKGVPPGTVLAPNRATQPSNVPAAQSTPQSPQSRASSVSPPSAVQSAPSQPAGQSSYQPAANQPPLQPAGQSGSQPAANQPPPQSNAALAAPRQPVQPPGPPPPLVNERCVLLCLDHGHLDEYCQRVCSH